LAIELLRTVIEALNNPFAIQILVFLLQRGEAKLTDILVFVTGVSKYRSVRRTIFSLEKAGLVEKEVITWGRAKKWNLRLTKLGEKIAKSILESLRSVLKEHAKKGT